MTPMRWRGSPANWRRPTADGLYVRIRSLNTARTSAEFKVAGAPAAIAAAYAGCPLTAATHAGALPPAGRPAEED